tara:strand:+ start:9751 stop:9942 length:192 start_codon:yes stop_codon:yes gene_type:complete
MTTMDLHKLIEIRMITLQGEEYEVHIDATEQRFIFDVFSANPYKKVTDEIRGILDKKVKQINN